MKFEEEFDKYSFLSEADRLDLVDTSIEEVPSEVFEFFIKRRRKTVRRLKDFRKSSTTKASWRKNRWVYMRGIKRFHRSIQGKRLHRAMGRFLALRYFTKVKPTGESLELVKDLALKAVSSIKTHFYIRQGYYMPLAEQVDFELFMDYSLPILRGLEVRLYEDINSKLNVNELELLLRVLELKEVHKSIVEVTGKNLETVQRLWSKGCADEVEGSYFLSSVFESVVNKLKR